MDDISKLHHLLEHWAEHNEEHARTYLEWAGKAESLGKKELADIFSNIARRLAAEAPVPKEGQTFEDRLDDVVVFLTKKGFVLDWEFNGDEYKINTHSCPYRQVVRDHRMICSLDQYVIGTMLDSAPVRITCFAHGDEHCTYEVSPQTAAQPIELMLE